MSSSSCSCPMDAIAAENRGEGGTKKKKSKSLSSWRSSTMALMKNRSQPGGESSSSEKKKKKMDKSISIGMSMACGGSICSTKQSSVLSRDRRRSHSSRSLKAPDEEAVAVAAISASSSFNSETTVATTTMTSVDSSSSSLSSPLSSIGVSRSFRKLSGCYYECHLAGDPRTSLGGGATMLSCADCDEFFTMAESLELHRATKHAVSELGADDTSRNVVEIIFRSSWLTQAPVCRIERILKVQSSGNTVERFEQYREHVKKRAASSSIDVDPRCAADGNELLRFHCTTFRCSLGLAGATSLCRATSPQRCKLCGIIRDGFRADGSDGKIATMATSGRAHDTAVASLPDGEKRAMLVCRVVAGRVKKAVVNGSTISSSADQCGSVDSVSSHSDLDQLFVFNPRAILPCFVVIYSENYSEEN